MAKLSAGLKDEEGAIPMSKTCAQCFVEKSLNDFNRVPKSNRKDGRSRYCKTCTSERTKGYRAQSPRTRFTVSMNTARTTARRKSLAFELSIEGLIGVWEKQKGLCFYSGVPMKYSGDGTPESVSLERVDSNKGYTPDNVVLCCTIVNRMKSDLPHSEFLRWCKAILDHGKGV